MLNVATSVERTPRSLRKGVREGNRGSKGVRSFICVPPSRRLNMYVCVAVAPIMHGILRECVDR